jgi:hypothetical protein
MKNIIIQLILFCCMIPTVLAQNKIKQYEYWLDGNFSERQVVNVTPTATLELNALPANSIIKSGLHRLNIRFIDTNNKYSAVLTQFVEGLTVSPQIASYEYWFDNSYSGKTVVALTPSSVINLNNINISAIANGMHSFNIRFLDRASKWSAVQTTKLYKSSGNNLSKNSIAGYRYWFDNNVGNSVYKNLSSWPEVLNSLETLDLSTFPKGNNHVLNIQFKDALGLWTAVQSTKIYNSGGGGNALDNAVTAYRYWIDTGFASCVNKTVNPSFAFVSVDESIDLSAFKGNNRKLYIQFKDALGLWSSIVTDTVNVPLNAGLNDVLADADNINVFPNPSKGYLTIATNRLLLDATIYIANTLGEIVYCGRYDMLNGSSLNLSELPSGVYFLRIVESDKKSAVTTRKIILQK